MTRGARYFPNELADPGFRMIDGVAYVPVVRSDGLVACHLGPHQAITLAHLMRAEFRHSEASEGQVAAAVEQIARFVVSAWTMSPELALQADRKTAAAAKSPCILTSTELMAFVEALEQLASDSRKGDLGREVTRQNCADSLRQIARQIAGEDNNFG